MCLIRLRFGCLARGGDRGAKLLQFVVEVLLVGEKLGQFAVLGVELGLLRLELNEGLFQHVVAARQHRRIEGETVGRLCLARIGAGEPEADVKQLLHRAGGVAGADGLFFVHRAIAQRVDVSRLGEHRFARRAAKARLVQECGDIVLIGQLQIWDRCGTPI